MLKKTWFAAKHHWCWSISNRFKDRQTEVQTSVCLSPGSKLFTRGKFRFKFNRAFNLVYLCHALTVLFWHLLAQQRWRTHTHLACVQPIKRIFVQQAICTHWHDALSLFPHDKLLLSCLSRLRGADSQQFTAALTQTLTQTFHACSFQWFYTLSPSSVAQLQWPCFSCNSTYVSSAGVYDPDQTGSGLLDILRGGTERFLTNIKDTSSKVIQSVAR